MSEMRTITGHVRNGRLIIDEPTDLPEGTELELIVVQIVLATGEVLEGEALEEFMRGLRQQQPDVATR